MTAIVCNGQSDCEECELVNEIGYRVGAPWLLFDCGGFEADRLLLSNADDNLQNSNVVACEIKVAI